MVGQHDQDALGKIGKGGPSSLAWGKQPKVNQAPGSVMASLTWLGSILM